MIERNEAQLVEFKISRREFLGGLAAVGASAFLPAAEAPVNVHAVSGATETALAFAVTTGLKA